MNKYFVCRKGVEINIWDINNLTKIWNSKPVSHYFNPTFRLFY